MTTALISGEPVVMALPAERPAAIETLLLVEDNSIDQMICERVIRRSGLVRQMFPFVYAADALAFLHRRDRPSVDAILLDINMPRMNGFEFLEAATRELGQNFARLVVVMLTTSLDPEDAARARRFPVVQDYFNKPLCQDYLERIAGHLTSVRSGAGPHP